MAEIQKRWTQFDPRDFMDELKEGDIEKALEWVDYNASWRIPGDPKYGGAVHEGKAGFRKFAELANYFLPHGVERLWSRVSHAPGVTFLEQQIRARTMIETVYENEYVFVFRHGPDGKLVEVKEYQDMQPMLEAFDGWEPEDD